MNAWLSGSLSFGSTYYAAAVIQTVSHRLFGHTKRVLAIYTNHTHGHHARYSRRALLQDEWIASERHVLWYLALPFAALAATVYTVFPLAVFCSHLAAIAFAFWWHITLHRHYHLRGSTLERFAWFREKRDLHFVHHRRVRSNYAICEYWLDRLLGTYRAPDRMPNGHE
jgi:hypothetical protein